MPQTLRPNAYNSDSEAILTKAGFWDGGIVL
jgi:hypothetical protein